MAAAYTKEQLKRTNVVGTSGSGKTHFARLLAERLDFPYIEMDQLFWGPHWQPVGDEVFLPQLAECTAANHWILDGNYSRTEPIKWRRVTAVIWIDYSFARTVSQAVKRAVKRSLSGNELWPETGNRESLRRSFLSRKSIVLYSIQSYYRVKNRYAAQMREPALSRINFIRLKTPRQALQFLDWFL